MKKDVSEQLAGQVSNESGDGVARYTCIRRRTGGCSFAKTMKKESITMGLKKSSMKRQTIGTMTQPIRYTILTDRYGQDCRLVVDPDGQWIFDPCHLIEIKANNCCCKFPLGGE